MREEQEECARYNSNLRGPVLDRGMCEDQEGCERNRRNGRVRVSQNFLEFTRILESSGDFWKI